MFVSMVVGEITESFIRRPTSRFLAIWLYGGILVTIFWKRGRFSYIEAPSHIIRHLMYPDSRCRDDSLFRRWDIVTAICLIWGFWVLFGGAPLTQRKDPRCLVPQLFFISFLRNVYICIDGPLSFFDIEFVSAVALYALHRTSISQKRPKMPSYQTSRRQVGPSPTHLSFLICYFVFWGFPYNLLRPHFSVYS